MLTTYVQQETEFFDEQIIETRHGFIRTRRKHII